MFSKKTNQTKNTGKNSSAQKKVSQKEVSKSPAVKSPAVPAEWLYMTPQEITVSNLLEALPQEKYPAAEIWREAGVLEVPFSEKSSMDIETSAPDLGDEYSNAFLNENQIKSLFFVTLKPEDFTAAREAMIQITEKCGGFFCGDTDDFTPVVK